MSTALSHIELRKAHFYILTDASGRVTVRSHDDIDLAPILDMSHGETMRIEARLNAYGARSVREDGVTSDWHYTSGWDDVDDARTVVDALWPDVPVRSVGFDGRDAS